MSVSVPVIRFDEESSTRALALLFEASSGLSAALGYQDRQAPVGPPGAPAWSKPAHARPPEAARPGRRHVGRAGSVAERRARSAASERCSQLADTHAAIQLKFWPRNSAPSMP